MTVHTSSPSGLGHSPPMAATGSQRNGKTIFGRETAYVTGLYLRRAVVFMGIILAIVLALDIVGRMTRVLVIE